MRLALLVALVAAACGGDGSTASGPAYGWSGAHGTQDDFFGDEGQGLALDAAGNVYLTGHFRPGTMDFGAGPLVNSGTMAWDGLVASFTPDGQARWSVRVEGGPTGAGMTGVATDGAANVYVTGRVGSGADIFVASFDADARPRWARSFGSPEDDEARAVVADRDGNVTITGSFWRTIDFGGGALVNTERRSSRRLLISGTAG